jgi:preprotein translocase subunit SecY
MSKPEDRGLFTVASKFLSIILTAVQGGAYILSGMYGSIAELGIVTVIVIFIQLIFAGIVVMLLDELVQKGWGLGSGISLFIMAGVAQNILWSAFNPTTGLFVGGLSQLISSGGSGDFTLINWLIGSAGTVYPSLIGFIGTIVAFLIIIYLNGFRIELPMSYAGYKGFRSKYPIKLLYVTNLPVIFGSALFANVYFFGQLIWSTSNPHNTNGWLNWIGTFGVPNPAVSNATQPTGGLVYYVTAPQNIQTVAADPLRALAYLGILVAFCAVFSLVWLEVGGLGPEKVAQQLMDSGMQIPSYRRSGKPIEAILKRYIPVVTVLGGIIVALVAGLADFVGVFGSGTGILLSVGIIYQYYELLMRERAAEMYPAFRRILGE